MIHNFVFFYMIHKFMGCRKAVNCQSYVSHMAIGHLIVNRGKPLNLYGHHPS